MSHPTRPILRYHGGKWRLAPWIISHFPEHRIYVESFGGAGSVLIRKERSFSEVYNDLDGEIVNLFHMVRDQGEELARRVAFTPYSRDDFLLSYEASDDPLEKARRTVARSFMGFGSPSACGHLTGFRSNSNRSHTVPAHDWANLPDALLEIVTRMRGVVIENKDAVDVIFQHDSPRTLHYVDPPYVWDTRAKGNPYCKKGYRFEMTDGQHERLCDCLLSLTGMAVVSGYDHPIYAKALRKWRRVEKPALADGARPRIEVLWLSPNIAHLEELRAA